MTALKFRPSKTDNDDGGKIHFGKVICGIVLMSNQAVPPCYLAKGGWRRGSKREKELNALLPAKLNSMLILL